MKKEYILILIILLLFTGCEKKTNNKENNEYENISCYKELEEDDIVTASRVDVTYENNKLYKVSILDKVIFSNDSLKYLINEVEYFKKYYDNKNKINGVTTEFESDETSYTATITINYDIIKKSDLENLDINYNFNKNITKTDLISKLETDNYICE